MTTDGPDDDVVDYTKLESLELATLDEQIRQDLLNRGELTSLNPPTEEGRRLHSQRVAIRVELKSRGLR